MESADKFVRYPIEGIGKLIDHTTHWKLVYERCGHVQEFARLGLQQSQQAVSEVRRHYAECLTCRLKVLDYLPYPES